MAYTLPTLDELAKLAQERHRAELPGTDAFLWPNTEYVFLKAVAGMVHMNFKHAMWVKKQRFVHEADGDELDAHGKAIPGGGMPRNTAARAHGNVLILGTPLHTLLVDTLFQRSDGVRFRLTAATTIETDGSVVAAIEAVDAGAASNTAINTPLDLVEPDINVTSVAVDTIGIGAGSDLEDDEAYRARLLFRLRNPPRGGNRADYVIWASSVPGVTRVWVERLAFGPGTVGVWIMADGSTVNGIPDNVLLGEVQDYLDTVGPETSRVLVRPPIAATMDVTINGITPTTAQQLAIEEEIRDVFRRRVAVSTTSEPFTMRANVFWQAVARVMGSAEHSIVLPADTVLPVEFIPILGRVCYV